MPVRTWGSADGNWQDGFRWVEGFVPTVADDVIIDSYNVNIGAGFFPARANSIELHGGGRLTTTDNLDVTTDFFIGGDVLSSIFNLNSGVTTVDGLFIGDQTNVNGIASGIVNVNSGTLNAVNLYVGYSGMGILNISNGGSVNVGGGGITVGQIGANGFVNIGGQSAAAAGYLNSNVVLQTAGSALTFRTTNDALYSGVVSGSGQIRQDSAGANAILTGNNTNTGLTSISAGTLFVGNGGGTGSLGSGAVANAGTLHFNRTGTQYAITNAITGTGNVAFTGNAVAGISGAGSYSGTTTLNAGAEVHVFASSGGSFGTGAITNNGKAVFFVGNVTHTVSSAISGSGTLWTSAGGSLNGRLILTGANTYSGTTNVSQDTTLQIGNGGTTGSLGTGAVVNNGVLDYNRSDVSTLANAISGAGNILFRGGSQTIVTGANTYSGTTTITAGSGIIVNSNLGTGNVLNSGGIVFSTGGTQIISNTISGAGDVAISGGTVILTGASTISGTTYVQNGTLQIGNGGTAGRLGSGDVVLINSGRTLEFNLINTAYTVSNNISGNGNVRYRGGSADVTGNNSYSMTTTIDNGAQVFFSGNAFGTSNITLNGTMHKYSATTATISGAISGTGGLDVLGGRLILTGANSYSGSADITAGATLQIGNGGTTGRLGDGAVVNNGTLDIFRSGSSYSFSNSISGSGNLLIRSAVIISGANTYTGTTTIATGASAYIILNLGSGNILNDGLLDLAGANRTVSSLISGTGSVISRTGTTNTFTANNTYTGTTNIHGGGTLQIGNGGSTGSLGAGAVANAGTLIFNRTGSSYIVSNDISGTGSVVFGGGGGTIINVTGNNSYSGGSTIATNSIARFFDSNDLGTGAVAINGTLIYSGTAETPLTNTISGTGTFVVNMTAGVAFLGGGIAVQAGSTVNFTINGTTDIDIIKTNLNLRNTINGGDGTDQIRGGNLVDTINGGNDADKIMALGGADILTGGAGNDQFRYITQNDSGLGAAADRITDYVIGSDRLNFLLLDADAVTPGDQAFSFIGTGAFAATGIGQIRYVTSGADIVVQADVDGNGVADMEIILQGIGGGTLTAADFIL